MKPRIFLSDNDGTLTIARRPAEPEVEETLIEFSKRFRLAIATGSPYSDMLEQHSDELRNSPNVDFWMCMGNVLYRRGREVFNTRREVDVDSFKPVMDCILKNCPVRFHKSYPRHFEVASRINFTMLGRPEEGEPSAADRAEYVEWDMKAGQRRWIIDYIEKNHPEYNATLGGQISVDIVKKGAGKEQVVDHYVDEFEIAYFGDRIYRTGNDNSIAHRVVDVGGTVYSVGGPDDTVRIMKGLIRDRLDGKI